MAFHELLVGEKVLHEIKQHNVIILLKVVNLVIRYLPWFIIPGALWFFHAQLVTQMAKIPFTPENGMSWDQVLRIVEIGIAGIILISLISKLYKLIYNWSHDQLVITNQRVIQIDQHFLWGKDMNFVHLKDIVNITEHHLGFWQVMFKYGEIMVDTSSAIQQDFMIKYIPHPEEVVQMIENAKNQSMVEAQAAQFQQYLKNLPQQPTAPINPNPQIPQK